MDFDQRLIHLTKVLVGVSESENKLKAFDMGFYLKGIPALDCGFAGCAIGWAASDSVFNELGLHMVPDDEIENWEINLIDLESGDMIVENAPGRASRVFFNINEVEYTFLFEPNYYSLSSQGIFFHITKERLPDKLFFNVPKWGITPQMVIQRIMYLLEVGRGNIVRI